MRHAKECVSTSAAALIVGALIATALVVTGTTASATPAQHHLAAPPAVHLVAAAYPDGANVHLAVPIAPVLVDVISGDTLSALSAAHLGDAARWTDLWNANRAVVANPNLIYPGQALTLPTGPVAAPAAAPIAAPKAPAPARPVHRKVVVHVPAKVANGAARVNPGSYSGFQACVIRRESGGNPQVMNSTGHYGLYQFDRRTWVSGGGSPATFGHATVTEQNAVFARVFAARGKEPWSPSDHC